MNIEHVFFGLHQQAAAFTHRVPPKTRKFIALLLLVASVWTSLVFLSLHLRFAGPAEYQNCLSSKLAKELQNVSSVSVARIVVLPSWYREAREVFQEQALEMLLEIDREEMEARQAASTGASASAAATEPQATQPTSAGAHASPTKPPQPQRPTSAAATNTDTDTHPLYASLQRKLSFLLGGSESEEHVHDVATPSPLAAGVQETSSDTTPAASSTRGVPEEQVVTELAEEASPGDSPQTTAAVEASGQAEAAVGSDEDEYEGHISAGVEEGVSSPPITAVLVDASGEIESSQSSGGAEAAATPDEVVGETASQEGSAATGEAAGATASREGAFAREGVDGSSMTPEDIKAIMADVMEELEMGISSRYTFAIDKGLLQLSKYTSAAYEVPEKTVTLYSDDTCFGDYLTATTLEYVVGYDTAMTHALLKACKAKGAMYFNEDNDNILIMTDALSLSSASEYLEDLILFKFGTLISSTFILFATSALISFVLRQTQLRMIKFT